MSDGFQVVMSDLQEAATTFHAEAKTFLGIMPDACPALPDGGSGAFNESLSAVVDAACLLHLQIGGDMDDNGSKLQTRARPVSAHRGIPGHAEPADQRSGPDQIALCWPG